MNGYGDKLLRYIYESEWVGVVEEHYSWLRISSNFYIALPRVVTWPA